MLLFLLMLGLSLASPSSFAEAQKGEKSLPKEEIQKEEKGETASKAAPSEEKEVKAVGEKGRSVETPKSDEKRGAKKQAKKEKPEDKAKAEDEKAKAEDEKATKHKLWPPLKTLISSPFGVCRSISGGCRHSGIDIRAHLGWPVCSLRDGLVTFSGRRGAAGLTVIVQQENGKTVSYCHLARCLVAEGAKVKKGEHIGLVGCTGRSTGAHLHISMRENDHLINPRREIKEAWEVFDPPLEELHDGVIEAQFCNGRIQQGSGPANAGLHSYGTHRLLGSASFNPRLDGDKQYLRMLKGNSKGLAVESYRQGREKRVPRLRGNAQYVRMRKALRGLNSTPYTSSKL